MKGVYIPVHDRLNEDCNKVSTKKDESQFISSVAFAHVADPVRLARPNRQYRKVTRTKGGNGTVMPLEVFHESEFVLGYMVKRLSAYGGCLGSKRR